MVVVKNHPGRNKQLSATMPERSCAMRVRMVTAKTAPRATATKDHLKSRRFGFVSRILLIYVFREEDVEVRRDLALSESIMLDIQSRPLSGKGVPHARAGRAGSYEVFRLAWHAPWVVCTLPQVSAMVSKTRS